MGLGLVAQSAAVYRPAAPPCQLELQRRRTTVALATERVEQAEAKLAALAADCALLGESDRTIYLLTLQIYLFVLENNI